MNNLGHFDDFAEEHLDYARCQRADGSYYGTSGVCRTGSAAGAKEFNKRMDKLAARMDKVDPDLSKKQSELRARVKKLADEYEKLKGDSSKSAAGKRKKIMGAITKLQDQRKELDKKEISGNKKPDTSLPANLRRQAAAARAKD